MCAAFGEHLGSGLRYEFQAIRSWYCMCIPIDLISSEFAATWLGSEVDQCIVFALEPHCRRKLDHRRSHKRKFWQRPRLLRNDKACENHHM